MSHRPWIFAAPMCCRLLLLMTLALMTLPLAILVSPAAFGWDSDMSRYGADAQLASAIIDWAPYYGKVADDVLQGRWKPDAVWWGARQDVVRLVRRIRRWHGI